MAAGKRCLPRFVLVQAILHAIVLSGVCLGSLAAQAAENPRQPGTPSQQAWQYLEPDSDGFSFRPIAKTFRLSEELPPDIEVEATFAGTRQMSAQIRFGSEDSTRVAVVIDELEDGHFDLYLDRDRDRVIRADEVLPVGDDPRKRHCELEAELIPELLPEHFPRSVVLRRSLAGDRLTVATAGVMQGTINFGDKDVPCIRVDGDANGLFANSADRIWIDVNQDGAWDAVTEQFAVRPLLSIGENRYALRADEAGSRITLDKVVGEGTIKLTMPSLGEGVSVQRLEVMLRGDDGSVYAISGLDSEISLPIGRYALTTISVLINDGKRREPWKFVFSHVSGYEKDVWHELTDGQELSLDVVGELSFEVKATNLANGAKPGDFLSIQPQLFTGDGLLINSCVFGDQDASWVAAHNEARLNLMDPGTEQTLDSNMSGFS